MWIILSIAIGFLEYSISKLMLYNDVDLDAGDIICLGDFCYFELSYKVYEELTRDKENLEIF